MVVVVTTDSVAQAEHCMRRHLIAIDFLAAVPVLDVPATAAVHQPIVAARVHVMVPRAVLIFAVHQEILLLGSF